MRIRVRSAEGVETITLGPSATVASFRQEVSRATHIPEKTLRLLKSGFPPVLLDLGGKEEHDASEILKDGDVINAEVDPNPPPSATSVATSPSLVPIARPIQPSPPPPPPPPPPAPRPAVPPPPDELDGMFVIRRPMIDDNSCLFSAVAYVLEDRDTEKALALRMRCADFILAHPDTYTEVMLGKPPLEYAAWIRDPGNWGGAIELSVFSKIYQVEIGALDCQSARIDVYGQNSGYSECCYLMYDGIHYDALAFGYSPDAPGVMDVTRVSISSRMADQLVTTLGLQMKQEHHYTDTSTFVLRCHECLRILLDPREMEHNTEQAAPAAAPPTEDSLLQEANHIPVLASQTLEVLAPHEGQIVLDCTLGRGGHAALIAPHLGSTGRYIGLDVDPTSLAFVRQRVSRLSTCTLDLVKANFSTAKYVLATLGVLTKPTAAPQDGTTAQPLARGGVHLLLADLGYSSKQLEDPTRGLSFLQPGPLDMRLDPERPDTAADLVNKLPEEDLANLIFTYGEEPHSRKIARLILEAREYAPITTTTQLADIVRRAYGRKVAQQQRIDPATKTFQALRIAVNGELNVLHRLLADVPILVRPGGIAAIISFHSLEDRLVKQAFAKLVAEGKARPVTRKPLVADKGEVASNPRSRSAKLRAIRMIDGLAEEDHSSSGSDDDEEAEEAEEEASGDDRSPDEDGEEEEAGARGSAPAPIPVPAEAEEDEGDSEEDGEEAARAIVDRCTGFAGLTIGCGSSGSAGTEDDRGWLCVIDLLVFMAVNTRCPVIVI
ncbi:putative Ribosomal RNA small subunit methyltransferase H [Paratrimastix pyriformis]|uniref:Ubiquitin thioesterase OTU1 n=1 Tax=Paratrimastix pyriformis TaxID=342808 RepID=A0ABQ8UE52_9EUKA|nr:putative Ribosomal RNA small subunit methyltransferase H [Paratrimastix pyriformis]